MSTTTPPIPPISIRIDIGAVSRYDALHILENIFKEADIEGYVGTCLGASPSGRYSVTVTERNIESAQYREDLLNWFHSQKADHD